ncbi:adenylyl-sulfate kinase [Ketobacter alkanivorans]|uniref:Adenylyl-sulfate kinase n=1 Tax=Ketobacter alkanivorans TaxID=1917421 RepID=A0A2K9LN05_9GAMM|nr:adenylyl-sulfate kinase [Ketobacter alkanivorans]AUM13653.1 adenylyl-sulfate kinase [Ketobacter alkanivorans]MCP5018305.1 adenylyl-sulfate kinase [Ketobacter sp.]
MTKQVATNVHWHHGEITRNDRARLIKQRGATLWFTGLSGSGKSTVAVALEQKLFELGHLSYRLDGDNIRLGINKNLGFSAEDRTENIRRIGEIAKLFADTGVITLSSFISPYQEDRDRVREIHAASGLPFIEVYVDCPLAEAEIRDPKGLYKKARAGEIKNFTGIDDPYEAPGQPEIHLRTAEMSVEEETDLIINYLRDNGYLGEQ